MSHLTPQLTPSQQDACQKLVDFILSDEHCIILQGHAGTGKTTIINEVVERSKQAYQLLGSLDTTERPLNIYFTAMTHKAKHALQERTEYRVSTFHSLFRLVPNKPWVNTTAFYHSANHLVIVDECSYIGYTELKVIQECLKDTPSLKFIFLGDNYQLTPVGLNHCPIFHQDYPVIELTEVIRQQNSPTIAQACERIRTAITTTDTGIIATNPSQLTTLDKKAWDKAMIESFKSDKLVKVIRYTNHQVKQTNGKLFKRFNKRRELQAGDVVINNHYYRTSEGYTSTTILADTELTITDIEPISHSSALGIYDALCIRAEDTQTGKSYTLYAPAYGGTNPVKTDGNYLFADLRPAYACTVHKSQGSTYDEVFINLNDFRHCYKRDASFTYRLLYVAFSRAKSKVYVTGDIA